MPANTETELDWLATSTPVLEKLLHDAPEFGSLELKIVFHNGRLEKIGTSREDIRKPGEAR